MADPNINPSATSTRHRNWIVIGLFIAGHAAFNSFFNPIGATEDRISEWLALPLMGAMLAQPVLFGAWAALAPGSAAMRIPLSLLALVAVFLASIPKHWNVFVAPEVSSSEVGEMMMLEMAFFGVALTTTFIGRKLRGWKICHLSKMLAGRTGTGQYSLKFLLVLTAICAVLLVVGRSLLAGKFWAESSFWNKVSSTVFTFGGITLLALFPMLIVPLIAMTQHPSLKTAIAILLLWAGLNLLSVKILVAYHNEPRAQVARQLLLMEGGAVTVGLASAFALRYAGYRFLKCQDES